MEGELSKIHVPFSKVSYIIFQLSGCLFFQPLSFGNNATRRLLCKNFQSIGPFLPELLKRIVRQCIKNGGVLYMSRSCHALFVCLYLTKYLRLVKHFFAVWQGFNLCARPPNFKSFAQSEREHEMTAYPYIGCVRIKHQNSADETKGS